jgi:hypothetical protein
LRSLPTFEREAICPFCATNSAALDS